MSVKAYPFRRSVAALTAAPQVGGQTLAHIRIDLSQPSTAMAEREVVLPTEQVFVELRNAHWDRHEASPFVRFVTEHCALASERAPSSAFSGDRFRQAEFLEGVGVDFSESWEREDTEMAATVWTHYARTRKSKTITKRPMADILIGAFSMRFSGLLTRNEDAGYSGTDRACELAHAGVNAQRARVRA